ncbi:hypothetical protein [Streptomyces sp. TLI_146]|uniref:hypothetical protein n=1 Tax=Streptomyces sp. TLI_146 TaxID=1938858 RepID=UPI000CA6FACB|nr:hypothetical protein [Streptomyces sp. TLI_146]PKV82858.1 hypothetical protein BX283_0323 [Streptomyces sp. TLI_146]
MKLPPEVDLCNAELDRTVRYGCISQQDDPWLRWILKEAAQTAERSPQFVA